MIETEKRPKNHVIELSKKLTTGKRVKVSINKNFINSIEEVEPSS